MHAADGTGYLETFFEEVKSAGFFKRLFSWSRIQALGYDAYKEYALLVQERSAHNDQMVKLVRELEDTRLKHEFSGKEIDRLKGELAEAEANNSVLSDTKLENEKRIAELTQIRSDNSDRIRQLQSELTAWSEKNRELTDKISEREKTITEFQTTEQSRIDDYQNKVSNLTALVEKVKEDERKLHEEREQAIRDQHEEMKRTWSAHEVKVEETIRGLCKKHQIEYLQKDKVPFKGKPDNTLLICQEYVVFDAKSPEGEDLSNFPDYVKSQAEKASKYVKEKDVRKEVFLVVPSNTIHAFPDHTIDLGEFRAYIITLDSLEPIILSLKKIEDYEFAEQLSPEERDDICRVIGRLSHLTKRRIQVDTFFVEEFFDALKSCRCLPGDMAQRSLDYEKATKVNPPLEQRAKVISDKELERAVESAQKEATYLELDTSGEVYELIQTMPLLKEKSGGKG